jgi:hypothetical protein
MSIELIFQRNCDLHAQADQKVDGETIPPVTLPNGKQKVLELCAVCQKEIGYSHLIDLAVLVGRDPEADPTKQKAKSAAARSHRAKPAPEGFPEEACPYCDNVYTNERAKQSVAMHITRSHPEEKAAAAAAGDIVVKDEFVCSECGHTLGTQQGLDRHFFSKHPELVDAN